MNFTPREPVNFIHAMAIIKQILSRKGSETYSVREAESVLDALKIMAEKNTGSVLVLDASGKLTGIFSERDYARKVVLHGKRSATTRVGDVMTRDPITVTSDTSIHECMTLMTENRVRHLPVTQGDSGALIGVISIGDIVKAVIRDQRETIRELEDYIHGGVRT